MEKIKLIMDVDTGTDDACALVMAMLDPAFDLLGITTVNGNLEVKLTTDNTLRVVQCCKAENRVKVYRGADLPMVCTLDSQSPQSLAPIPHREGMVVKGAIHAEHLPLPPATIHEEAQRAVPWLIETLSAAKDHSVTIVAVGPMTNIGLALRSDERIAKKIKQLVLMAGGDRINNATAAAEFNAFGDPEALEIIMQSGIDVVMVPLDATHQVLITEAQAHQLGAIGTAPALLIQNTILERIEAYAKRDSDMAAYRATPLHDPLALCYVIHPEVLTQLQPVNCHIARFGLASGQTIFDWRQRIEAAPTTCRLALKADSKVFVDWMSEILTQAKNQEQ